MSIDWNRVEKEAEKLAEYYIVLVDQNNGFVRIKGFPLPDGWSEERSEMLFDLPDTYPEEPPDAYMPERLVYQGQKWKYYDLRISGSEYDGWEKVCLWKGRMNWNPITKGLISISKDIKTAAKNPENPNWLTAAADQ